MPAAVRSFGDFFMRPEILPAGFCFFFIAAGKGVSVSCHLPD
jgi:hypothetical protein